MIAAQFDPGSTGAASPERFARQLETDSRRIAAYEVRGSTILAALTLRAQAASWTPGLSASGRRALFNGQLHNRAALAELLRAELAGSDPACPASVYAAAVDRWGDRADDHAVGHYCAIVVTPGKPALRLSRSPFDGPPLHFRSRGETLLAASMPRCLFWQDDKPPPPDLRRLGMMTYAGFGEEMRGWHEGCGRVPLGTVVELSGDGASIRWRYDLFARPTVRFANDRDYVEAAREIFDRGVDAALEGCERPAGLVSGGLDSASVAASALLRLPAGRRFEAFTFGPEPDWQGETWTGMFVDEYSPVRRLAERYPALRAHYSSSTARDFRHGQRDLMRVLGCAPPSLALAWKLHEPLEQARDLGCDVMLVGDFGNEGFSAGGSWAYCEYLLSLRWGQLLQALRRHPFDSRPLWRKFLSLSVLPLLPRALWQRAVRLGQGGMADPLADSGMTASWIDRNGLADAAAAAGFDGQRFAVSSQTGWWRQIMLRDRDDVPELYHGLHQLYGIPVRDPTAYRPLVEFCYGLPTDQFMRDGQDRWLARRMAEGRLPEEQRLEIRQGAHDPDWHRRIGRARADLIEELDRMADDPDIAAFVDIAGLRRNLENFPAESSIDPAACQPYVAGLVFGMTAGRFIAFAKGRNDI